MAKLWTWCFKLFRLSVRGDVWQDTDSAIVVGLLKSDVWVSAVIVALRYTLSYWVVSSV